MKGLFALFQQTIGIFGRGLGLRRAASGCFVGSLGLGMDEGEVIFFQYLADLRNID